MSAGTAPRRRQRLEVLDEATARRLLATAEVGRLAHVADGAPTVAVVSVGVDGDDVVLRSAPGTRLAAVLARPGLAAAIEVDDLDPATRTGWSVVVHGRLVPVLDAVEVARLERDQRPSWLLGDTAGTWLRLVVREVDGRRVVPGRADRTPDLR